MAGIAGVISPVPWDSSSLLEQMSGSLRYSSRSRAEHWNNDRAGMCRVRTGADNSAPQPLFSRNKTKCIIFFGECFGYEGQKRELTRLGHIFEHGDNDAEYCLRLYEEYGEKAFSLLSGSFSFALYDTSTGELLLANDRLGSRPLFYSTTSDNKLIFATQVATILRSPEVSRDLDTAAVLEFCTLQRVLGDKTYHRGVKMLPPASLLRFRDGKLTISRYWRPEYRPQPGTHSEYAEELAATMRKAMREVMRGDDQTGVLLSGGLDARMMVAAADAKLTCYTFADYQNPEYQTARKVAEAKGFELRFLQRDPDHYPNMVDTAVELGSGMYPFNHAHTLGYVENIAEKCTALTHGYGIEALFRGTTLPKQLRTLYGIPLGSRLDPTLNEENLPYRMYRRAYSMLGRYPGLFMPGVADSLEGSIVDSAKELLSGTTQHSANEYDQLLLSDVFSRNRYPSYIFTISMRSYLNERSVVFNNEVIDLHLKTPVEHRSDNRLWLKAMARLDSKVAHVVNANTGHSPFMPSLISEGIKSGKAALGRLPLLWRLNLDRDAQAAKPGLSPISWARFDWLISNNQKLRQLITDTLNDPEALPPHIFNIERINGVLAEHLASQGQHRNILFALLTFGRWHKKHGLH